jgi:hypothetical protein
VPRWAVRLQRIRRNRPRLEIAKKRSRSFPHENTCAGSRHTRAVRNSPSAQLSIDITNPSDWQISNGVISLDWNSTTAHVFSVHLAGHPDELVDTTTTQNGQPDGLYMDNSGVGSGTTSASYQLVQGQYLDWWITTESNSTNAFTYTQHYILRPVTPAFMSTSFSTTRPRMSLEAWARFNMFSGSTCLYSPTPIP